MMASKGPSACAEAERDGRSDVEDPRRSPAEMEPPLPELWICDAAKSLWEEEQR